MSNQARPAQVPRSPAHDDSGRSPSRPNQSERTSTGASPQVVTLRAYEVYRYLHGEQKAMITGGCRGGFSCGELIAFLYAYPFPKAEWRQRVDEAFKDMKL